MGKRYLAQRHKGTKLSDVFGPCPGFFWKFLGGWTDPKKFPGLNPNSSTAFLVFLNLPAVCGDGNRKPFFPEGIVISCKLLVFSAVGRSWKASLF